MDKASVKRLRSEKFKSLAQIPEKECTRTSFSWSCQGTGLDCFSLDCSEKSRLLQKEFLDRDSVFMDEGDPADEDDPELYASVWSLQEEPSLGSSWTPAFGCREANSGQRPLPVRPPMMCIA